MRVALVILLAWLAPLTSAQVLRSEANPATETPQDESTPLVLQSAANPPPQARSVDEAITRLREQMREIADAPKGEGGDLTQDQAEKFDTLKGELAAVDKRIERQSILDASGFRVV